MLSCYVYEQCQHLHYYNYSYIIIYNSEYCIFKLMCNYLIKSNVPFFKFNILCSIKARDVYNFDNLRMKTI